MPKFLQKVIAGTFQLTGGSPGDGKVLVSDASGNASWTTPTVAAHKTSHATGGSDALAPSDIGALALSTVDAKGDLLVGTANDTVARVAVGAVNGQVLTVDSTTASGVAWAAADNTVYARTGTSGAIANSETVAANYTIPANSLAAGDTFIIHAFYVRSGTNATQGTARVRVGSTTLTGNIAATLTFPGAATAVAGKIEALVTFRSVGNAGTVLGSMVNYHQATSPVVNNVTSAVAADTTGALIIELTVISGQASNSYTFYTATITRLV